MSILIQYDIRSSTPVAKVTGLEYLPEAVIHPVHVAWSSAMSTTTTTRSTPMLALFSRKGEPVSHRVLSCDLSDPSQVDFNIRRFVEEVTGDINYDTPQEFIDDVKLWLNHK